MYFLKIVEKMLSHEENKTLKESKSSIVSKNSKYQEKDKIKKQSYSKKDNIVDQTNKKYTNNARGLFSANGESLLVYYNNVKMTLKLDGISHPNKNDSKSRLANKLINDHCKAKPIYVTISSEDKENNLLTGEVFLDKDKKISLNKILIEEGLSMSNNVSKLSEKEVTNFQKDFETNVPKNNDSLIGYVKNFGKAPYLNKKDSKNSYFITILNNENKEITKWGIDLERAIKDANVEINNYVNLKKIKSDSTGTYQKSLWKIEILKDLDRRHQDLIGPHMEDVPVEYDDENTLAESRIYEDMPPYDFEGNMEIEHESNMDEIMADFIRSQDHELQERTPKKSI